MDFPQNIREVEKTVIFDVLNILTTSGVVSPPNEGWQLDTFVDSEVAKVV